MMDESDESGIDLSNEVAAIEVWAKENLSFEQAIHLFAVHKATADYLLDEEVRDNAKETRILDRLKLIMRSHDEHIKEAIDMLIQYAELEKEIPRLIVDTYQEGFKKGKSIAPKKNAIKRHAENRAMKADVFAWLDSHTPEFTVNEVAARAIIKQQPITHGTARDWFKEWKKLRSASTP